MNLVLRQAHIPFVQKKNLLLLAKEKIVGKKEHVPVIINQDPKTIRTLVNYIVYLQSMLGNLRANARSFAEERVTLKTLLLDYIKKNS